MGLQLLAFPVSAFLHGVAEGMEFPVDFLGSLRHEDLELSAKRYTSGLLHSDPDNLDYFILPTGRTVPLSLATVGSVPLYGVDATHKVLGLFIPEDQSTAVALFLGDQWWAVQDILKTSDSTRDGLLKVESLGEKIVLYVLNRIVYRAQERSPTEVPFLCHSETDFAKILWQHGEAIGFYSVKPTGTLCYKYLTQCYQLPVMNSIFLKKQHRGKGYGLQILEDFVDSFSGNALGLRFPLSPAMYKVCKHYLDKYPGDQDLLWEVEGVGSLFQRASIAKKIESGVLKGNYTETLDNPLPQASTKTETVIVLEDDMEVDAEQQFSKTTEKAIMEQEQKDLEKTDEEAKPEDIPVSRRTRSNQYKRKKLREPVPEVDEEIPEITVHHSPVLNAINRSEVDIREDATEIPILEDVPQINESELEHEESQVDDHEQNQSMEPEVFKNSDMEPVNGELTDDLTQTSLVAERSAIEVSHTETNIQSDNSLTDIAVVLDKETANDLLEDDAEEKGTASTAETEEIQESDNLVALGEESLTVVENEIQGTVEHAPPQSSADVASEPCGKSTEEQLMNLMDKSEPEDAAENIPSTETKPNSKPSLIGVDLQSSDTEQELIQDLSQNTLLLVEIKDVSFQPLLEEEKSQPEESAEEQEELPLQEMELPIKKKTIESSSEEAEIEPPVVDRRNLRRKSKVARGPAKKRGKIAS
ncbi:soluble lamin-associated protein of 75 kDa isoform X2 [Polypterus senegalus]|uniref:soluble lamin-associated protein of 75 kDa isoform X2 n=1 Tax=Polypterus senegalus TaxID=55291 RepID=UPI0019637A44|nr:soluble lamin-associated protein of 75 kDa isoform X2 [Polypterus senegalus]